jgi:hypothetical protein
MIFGALSCGLGRNHGGFSIAQRHNEHPQYWSYVHSSHLLSPLIGLLPLSVLPSILYSCTNIDHWMVNGL